MLGGLLTSFTTLCRGHVCWEAYLPVLPLSVEDMYIGRLTYQFYHSLRRTCMLGGLLTSFTTLCRGHVYWEAYLPVLPLSVEDMYIGRLTYQFHHSL